MTDRVIRQLAFLKHIAVIATGYNNVDLKSAAQTGIRVTNVRGYARHTVPQHTFALILNLASRILEYQRDVKKGEWQKSSTFNLLSYTTFELAGKTIGIIGIGAIGKGVAQIAEGFGMKVIVYDPPYSGAIQYKKCPFDELLAQADIVTLHCPLTAENNQLINSAALNKMKSSAILINTARAGVKSSFDLYEFVAGYDRSAFSASCSLTSAF